MSTLQMRLNTSEGAVEELKKKGTALAAELPFLQTRLRASERTVEQLRRENTVLSVRLCRAETFMDQLRRHVSVCNSSSDDSENQVEQLTTEPEDSVSALTERLNNSERQLGELQRSSSDMMSRLNICEKSLEKLESNHTELQVRVNVGEEHLKDLATKQTGGYVELLAVVLRLNSSVEQLDQRSMQNKGEAFKDVHSSVASESCLVCQIMSMFSDAVVKLEFVTKDAASDDTMMTERRSEELEVNLSAVQSAVRELKGNYLEDMMKKQEELEVRVSVGEEQLERLTIKQTGTKLWKIHNGSVRNKFKTKKQTNKIAFMF
ncbi:paramyosin-like isoform X1 [Cynoglossus semilaevis]|uniref:paramyosin-like isoform X1 n=1 Tax=Cynoglossus semilaevis TaxID=244447 RepID=UPI000D62E9C6|nr:paramyosin-like isoform X1 [Cynoglossus semilaevis]